MQTRSHLSVLVLLLFATTISSLSIDIGGEINSAPKRDVEVEFDLDPDSKLQFNRYASSRSDRPVLDGRSKLPNGDPIIRPIGGTTKVEPSLPSSTVLEPTGFNFGRGVAYSTTEDVAVGDELLSFPLNKVMSLESAARGRVGLLLEVNPDLPPAIALAVHLLEERALGTKSNFSDFIQTLPAINSLNSSMFYSDEELELLQGSQLLRYTQARSDAVKAFYDALVVPVTSIEAVNPPLFKKKTFTLDNFRWAMGVVWGCSFPFGDNEEDVVLAPILDTIGVCTEDDGEDNDICPPSRVELDTSANKLVMYATSSYKQGQEVRVTMPRKSSAQLMLNHGFMRSQSSPKLDKLDVTITLDPSDALVEVKNFMVQSQLNESINGSYALYHGSKTLGDAISTSMKMKLLSGSEMPRFRELLPSEDSPTNDRKILSLRNEFVFTRAIISTCKSLMEQYVTTFEDDKRVLAELTSDNDTDHTRAIQLRRMLVLEKEILLQTMDLAMEDWKDLLFSAHPNLQEV
ncbi:hypothetical protein PHYBOEH_011166 [Phytophthora boehmeriae]|uniref:Rubisco LSMT substrate-binding domain-containing protein n=1 Tax=Phytophthora boehmeriae TaxID=109152 RepID=A0A8T1VLZ9_9STRA|nr:hypothetical protein PHYBOEH_011166 [Phytophthora boehmeriae]